MSIANVSGELDAPLSHLPVFAYCDLNCDGIFTSLLLKQKKNDTQSPWKEIKDDEWKSSWQERIKIYYNMTLTFLVSYSVSRQLYFYLRLGISLRGFVRSSGWVRGRFGAMGELWLDPPPIIHSPCHSGSVRPSVRTSVRPVMKPFHSLWKQL